MNDVIDGLKSNSDSLVSQVEKQQQDSLATTKSKLSSFVEEFTHLLSQMLEWSSTKQKQKKPIVK